MMDFPNIKGLQWLSNVCPDLVVIKVALENTAQSKLGIPGFKPDETITEYHLDMSRLAGIRNWYDKGCDEASDIECLVDFSGVNALVLMIEKEELIKAWMFYKNFKHDNRHI